MTNIAMSDTSTSPGQIPLTPAALHSPPDEHTTPETSSFPGPWEANILSPHSRDVVPITIYDPSCQTLYSYPHDVSLSPSTPVLIYDFGILVGGIITLEYTCTGRGKVGLAFSESRTYTGVKSDGSNGTYHDGGDGAYMSCVCETENGRLTVPERKQRGGFRYLTIFTHQDKPHDPTLLLHPTKLTTYLTFQPTWTSLRSYGGYFHSSDPLLNRIWYAGAYTLQTNAIAPHTGRVYPLLNDSWDNSAHLGTEGGSIFVDGSKRDRATWAGDLGVALPSAFVSTGDYESARNALQLQYDLQQPSGELPMAGPPLNFYGSDTYHLTTLLATYDYVLYSGDLPFLTHHFEGIKRAISFCARKIDNSGLLHVSGTNDWGRYAQGGYNTEANALMYGALATGSVMAGWVGRHELGEKWMETAGRLKGVANGVDGLWDAKFGAFKDSTHDSSIHPQDGNSLALLYGLASTIHKQPISTHLTKNWSPIGALCPELPGNICPFIESMEIKGHLAARQCKRALELMRVSWGWYLNHPDGTGSTCIEGYLADGSWGYRASSGYGGDYSYTSHAHGWSTGPTHALTTWVLGLQLLSPGGKEWILAPQFGDLKSAEGGFRTNLGKFSAKWRVEGPGYVLEYDVPVETSGILVLPAVVGDMMVTTLVIDGEVCVNAEYHGEGESVTVTVNTQKGGKHSISVVC